VGDGRLEAEPSAQRPSFLSLAQPEALPESEEDSLAQLFARLEKVARKAEATEPAQSATVVPLHPAPRRALGVPPINRSSERY